MERERDFAGHHAQRRRIEAHARRQQSFAVERTQNTGAIFSSRRDVPLERRFIGKQR